MIERRARWKIVLLAVLGLLACRPPNIDEREPPMLDRDTRVLAVFDPALLIRRGAGLELLEQEDRRALVTNAELPAPALIGYGPLGEAASYSNIEFRFNRPLLTPDDRHGLDPEAIGLRIEPEIRGALYFTDPTRLVFWPYESLPDAHVFEVRLDARFTAADGPEFEAKVGFSFGTKPLEVWLRMDDGDELEEYHQRARVLLATSGHVELGQARAHVHAAAIGEGGKLEPIPIELREGEKDSPFRHDFEIRPRRSWPAGREVLIRVDEDLVGSAGPRPLGEEESLVFRVSPGVRVTAVECYAGDFGDGCDLGPLEVRFSVPIPRAHAKYVRVLPSPSGFDTLAHEQDGWWRDQPNDAYWSVLTWGDYREGARHRVVIDPKLRDIHGQPLAGPREFEVDFVEPPPAVTLVGGHGTLVHSQAQQVGIESRHVERLRVRVAVLDELAHERLVDALRHAALHELDWPSEGATPFDERIDPVTRGRMGWASTEIDLRRFSKGRPAAILLETAAETLSPRAAGRAMPPAQRGLVQLSELGVSVIGSLTESWIRVADVRTDQPIVDAEVELIDSPGGVRRKLGETDADGLLALPSRASISTTALLRVRKGDDRLLLSIAELRRADSKPGLQPDESVRITITTDRRLYRPGERMRVIGWAAIAGPYQLAGVRPLPAKSKIQLELRAAHGPLLATQTVTAKPHGKFWATITVPEDVEIGAATLTVSLLGSSSKTPIEIRDFAAPDFEVTAEAARVDLHHGESTVIDVDARYHFGKPVPIGTMRESLRCRASSYRPPGLPADWRVSPSSQDGPPIVSHRVVKLPDSARRGHVPLPFEPEGLDPSQPYWCTSSIALADVSKREVGVAASGWVHPKFYVAAAIPRWVEQGSEVAITVATLDHDGSRRPSETLTVTLVRDHDGKTTTLPPCKTNTLAGDARCRFTALERGSYEVEIVAGRGKSQTRLAANFWTGTPRWPPSKPPEQLTVEVDKPEPEPGELVRARITAPWPGGSGLLLLSKGAIHEVRRFALKQGVAELELRATDAWIPGVELWAVMIQPGDAVHQPRLQHAHTKLSPSNQSRRLDVTLEVPAEARPGSSLPILVRARDRENHPVRGHVSVWAVDEAVLALVPHEPDPILFPGLKDNSRPGFPGVKNFIDAFTVALTGGIAFVDGYRSLLFPYAARDDRYQRIPFVPGWTRDPEQALAGFGRSLDPGFSGRGTRVPQRHSPMGGIESLARSKVDAAPIFIGDAELDADGVARLFGELPDDLTTYRVIALVSSPIPDSRVEARFGSADARVRVTRALVVRAAVPKILRPGDRADVAVLVDNLGARAGVVEIRLAIDDPEHALELRSLPVVERRIATGDRVWVPFTIRARHAGVARLEVHTELRPDQGQPLRDIVTLELPVELERTMIERAAVYGTLDDDDHLAVLPFVLPATADPRFGGLSLSLGSSLLGELEDAVDYLVQSSEGGVEQTSSSLLPLLCLGIPDTEAYLAAGIERLQSMQLESGGFGDWPASKTPSMHGSAYAAWVLARVQAAGHAIPAAMLDRAHGFLLGEVSSWSRSLAPSRDRDIEIAYALAALAAAGRAPPTAIDQLHQRRLDLPPFARTLLLLAIRAQDARDPRAPELLAELRTHVDERDAGARMQSETIWTWYWDSQVRSSALLLIAMLAIDPEHALVPKLARGLLDDRRGGRWSNTQENAFSLLALAEYARIHEAGEPDYDGRIWLDGRALVRLRGRGRGFASARSFTELPELLEADRDHLLIQREGVGRMVYRVGLEWASTELPVRSEGLSIKRWLRDESGDLVKDKPIRVGALLAMDVMLETSSVLTHVAIELPLPAGLEAIDVELGDGSPVKVLGPIYGGFGKFVSHQELRRDRALVFADQLAPGTHFHTIWLRAMFPGDYQLPPASAQMIYYPEVYSRTDAGRITIE